MRISLVILMLFQVHIHAGEIDQTHLQNMLKRAEIINSEARSLRSDLEGLRNGSVGISSVSTSSFTSIMEDIERTIENINITMVDLQNLIKTTSSTIERVGARTEEQVEGIGTTLQDEIERIGMSLDNNLNELNTSVTILIIETGKFIEESKLTLRDIRLASEKTVGFVKRLDGDISVGLYGSSDGLNSEAFMKLWLKSAKSYDRFVLIGARDIDTSAKLDIEGGVQRGPLSIGMGFIEEGIGASISYEPDFGFDVKGSVSHLNDPFVNLKVGYTLESNIRPFVFVDDVLEDPSFGGGISYGVGF